MTHSSTVMLECYTRKICSELAELRRRDGNGAVQSHSCESNESNTVCEQDNQVVCVTERFLLRCPYSLAEIQEPVQLLPCKHVADLYSMDAFLVSLRSNLNSKPLQCAICSCTVTGYSDLVPLKQWIHNHPHATHVTLDQNKIPIETCLTIHDKKNQIIDISKDTHMDEQVIDLTRDPPVEENQDSMNSKESTAQDSYLTYEEKWHLVDILCDDVFRHKLQHQYLQ